MSEKFFCQHTEGMYFFISRKVGRISFSKSNVTFQISVNKAFSEEKALFQRVKIKVLPGVLRGEPRFQRRAYREARTY